MLWAGALLMLLAACGTASSPTSTSQSDGYLLTLKVSQGDTRDAVASKYGAEVIAWLGDQAILKLSDQAAAALPSRGISLQATTLEPNSTVKSPEVSAQGFSAWAGGFSAWAGGFSAWAGGWSAWAGGTSNLPTLPSGNRYMFMQTKLPQAQAIAKNFGNGITVAVIDTGIDLTHPMFTGRLTASSTWMDYVDGGTPQEATGTAYGHGTAVAGLVLQVAPRATILPIRVLGPDGSGEVANVISAISYAISNGAQVINLSLGTTTNVAALQTVIDAATAQGIYVVTSAGNTGDSNITYPAAWAKTGINAKYLISVGSVGQSLLMSLFSSAGAALEFVAPGELIQSVYPGSQVATYIGTSFAAPQVAGTLALALSDTAAANKGNLESYLYASDTPIGSYGLINVAGFLQQAPDFVRRKALLVVGNTTLAAGDAAIKARLESLGYTVTLKSAPASATSDATGKDLVLISATINSTDVNTKFRDVSIPVIVGENALYDDMKMTATPDTERYANSGLTQLAISNSAHPLAAGFLGTQTVFSSSDTMNWGKPSSSAARGATLTSDTSKAVIFGYDSGASMVGLTAPARRVGLMLYDLGASKLTAQGAQLLEAAITWAVSGN